MTLAPGTRLGSYEILSAIGAGGMGEVYKAHDTRLGRSVAIKILPTELAADPHFRERFDREAHVIAQLDHPHICTLFDVGEQDGAAFLVMQYLEGETLEKRLKKGALPIDQALRYATQIADALDTAHRAGVVHRDLKPGNVMLTNQGAKLLDFGLAKTLPVATTAGLSHLPTKANLTAHGTILGTFRYMAPEQLEGHDTDGRTDIFALGTILYEMVTGRRAFEGGSQASLIASILTHQPRPIREFQLRAPTALDRVIQTCLEKDRDKRWQSAREVAHALAWISDEVATPNGTPSTSVRFWKAVAAGLAAMGLILGGVAWKLRPVAQTSIVRFDVPVPVGVRLGSGARLSPDGRKLAFFATAPDGTRAIWVHSFDASIAQPLSGTDGASRIFWSADSQYLGFYAPSAQIGEPGRLKKVAVAGGPPQILTSLPQGVGFSGATWNADGVILLGATNIGGTFRGPLLCVSAAGGQPTPCTELDRSREEQSHKDPNFLPDGRHYIFLAYNASQGNVAFIGTLGSNERRPLAGIDSETVYAPSGHLLFLRDGSVMAQAFDMKGLGLVGEPFPVAEGVPREAAAGIHSVSNSGALAFLVVGPASATSQLAWFDRKGTQITTVGPKGQYRNIELAPDGSYVAFERGSPADIWILDIPRGLASRFTTDPSLDRLPTWSPDGRTIVFASHRGGAWRLFKRPVGNAGQDELVATTETPSDRATDWSHDGRYLSIDPPGSLQGHIQALELFGDHKLLQVTSGAAGERAGRISPDGRWIAYLSNESGRSELNVQTFPQPGPKRQVSVNGALLNPRWSRDGKELFYLSPDLDLMAASIKITGPSLETGVPIPLFRAPVNRGGGVSRVYDVSADGRFLVNVAEPAQAVPPRITVVLNWAAALK